MIVKGFLDKKGVCAYQKKAELSNRREFIVRAVVGGLQLNDVQRLVNRPGCSGPRCRITMRLLWKNTVVTFAANNSVYVILGSSGG